MLKRILAFLILSVLIFSCIPFSASADVTLTQTVSGFNTQRSANSLIIYTRGGSSTGTNMYGYEVVVTNGIVTALGGNNNQIPTSSGSSYSFVVSGHGTMATWLQENIVLGMKASYQMYNYKVTFVLDSQSNRYIIDAARTNAVNAKEYAAKAFLVYDQNADSRFEAAESAYNSLGSEITEATALALSAEYNAVADLYAEREVAEYRGLWLRPKQTSAAEVELYVKNCYLNGINLICIETMYNATMICPMPSDSLFEHNPTFNGFDVLGAFVNACHRYGIELHCWMPVFYSSMSSDANYTRSPAYKRPDWQLKTNNGSSLYKDETSGMVFLNPALDEVQDFLIETYTYILNTYDIDGFQLDYIRYRDRTSYDDYGYDSETISMFKSMYPSYRNYNITYSTFASYWNDWVAFRVGKVTEFVEKMRNLIDTVAPDVVLSADVGPQISSSYSSLYQDTATWLNKGWLDMVHPMAYSDSCADYVEPFFNYVDDGCLVVPGLGTFMDEFDANSMLNHTNQMADIGCDGVIFFESETFISKKVGELLTKTLYTEQSLAPALNNANTIIAVLERMAARLDRAYDSNAITWQQCNDVTWSINQARDFTKTNAKAAAQQLKYLIDDVNIHVPAGELRDRLVIDAKNAYAAALRDQGIDVPEERVVIDNTIPDDAKDVAQLTIDKINGKINGEDTSLIIGGNNGAYNLRYAYLMLLQPVVGKQNVYELVASRINTGNEGTFSIPVTDNMLIFAVHSDDAGSGAARKKLARSFAVGSQFVLYGVDLENACFTSLNSMFYEYIPSEDPTPDPDPDPDPEYQLGDVNADGAVDIFDYLTIKSAALDLVILTDEEFIRADVNEDDSVDVFDYLMVKTICIESGT